MQELRFVTRYALTLSDTIAAAIAPLGNWRLWLAVLLFLPLPGVLILLLIRPRGWDAAAIQELREKNGEDEDKPAE